MTDREPTPLAWAAGYWDGEGTVSLLSTQYPSPQFSLTQAGDEAVELAERFLSAVQLPGAINGPYQYRDNRYDKFYKPVWKLRVTGFENVQALVAMCWPWLSRTKRTQATIVLNRYHAHRVANGTRWDWRSRTHCPQGHPYDEANTGKGGNGYKRCKACHRQSERNRRLRLAAVAEATDA